MILWHNLLWSCWPVRHLCRNRLLSLPKQKPSNSCLHLNPYLYKLPSLVHICIYIGLETRNPYRGQELKYSSLYISIRIYVEINTNISRTSPGKAHSRPRLCTDIDHRIYIHTPILYRRGWTAWCAFELWHRSGALASSATSGWQRGRCVMSTSGTRVLDGLYLFRLHPSSFLGLPYRSLNINPKRNYYFPGVCKREIRV